MNALPENPFSAATQLIVTYAYEYYYRRGEGDGGALNRVAYQPTGIRSSWWSDHW